MTKHNSENHRGNGRSPAKQSSLGKTTTPPPGIANTVVELAFYTVHRRTAIIIVGVINRADDGSVVDWAAYVGARPATWTQAITAANVAACGNKLSLHHAAHYFPSLPLERYRR